MPRQTQAVKTLSDIIRAEAASGGVLPFARFMELALHCPVHGYYETQKDSIGRRGDFYTSASVGELFGQLLAFQFAGWLEKLQIADCKLQIIEAGAHDGQLAKDILNWLRLNRPKLFAQIEYCILEPSARRRQWQNETLAGFEDKIRWAAQFSELKNPQSIRGVFFSNELLDAFSIRRFGWNAKNKNWFEWGVAVDGEKFVWAKIQNLDLPASILRLPSPLLDVLPDDYTIETSLAAENWWRAAAGILQRGKLLTIDYGLTTDELFLPQRKNGTLRAYFRHHFSDDVLANVGKQDLTAHVNFSAIQKAGEDAGLKTETFCTQPQFLTQILSRAVKEKSFAGLDAKQARQFQTLTHPEHLGRAFRVLIQSR